MRRSKWKSSEFCDCLECVSVCADEKRQGRPLCIRRSRQCGPACRLSRTCLGVFSHCARALSTCIFLYRIEAGQRETLCHHGTTSARAGSFVILTAAVMFHKPVPHSQPKKSVLWHIRFSRELGFCRPPSSGHGGCSSDAGDSGAGGGLADRLSLIARRMIRPTTIRMRSRMILRLVVFFW